MSSNPYVMQAVMVVASVLVVALAVAISVVVKRGLTKLDDKIGGKVDSDKAVDLLLGMLNTFLPMIKSRFGERYAEIVDVVNVALRSVADGTITPQEGKELSDESLDAALKATGVTLTEQELEFVKTTILPVLVGVFVKAPSEGARALSMSISVA